jgi:ABC-type nickel/cobalt efflux system permease component RcnA
LLPKPLLYIIYVLMIIIGLVAMYSLLNAGNPESLLRPFFPDPKYDLYVAMISSVLVFILGFFVFFSRDRESFRQLVALNAEKIKKLREAGKKDEDIADSILAAMGSHGGYKHNMARKKLLIYLSEFR